MINHKVIEYVDCPCVKLVCFTSFCICYAEFWCWNLRFLHDRFHVGKRLCVEHWFSWFAFPIWNYLFDFVIVVRVQFFLFFFFEVFLVFLIVLIIWVIVVWIVIIWRSWGSSWSSWVCVLLRLLISRRLTRWFLLSIYPSFDWRAKLFWWTGTWWMWCCLSPNPWFFHCWLRRSWTSRSFSHGCHNWCASDDLSSVIL